MFYLALKLFMICAALSFAKTPNPSSMATAPATVCASSIPATRSHPRLLPGRRLRVAVVGGGPAGASAAEALAAGGVETFLIERSPGGSKPCGGAIPLCMLDEFSLPMELVDRRVTRMRIYSPSNVSVDFGRTLGPSEYIAMLRREVLDSFLRDRAASHGAELITGLVTGIDMPPAGSSGYPPYKVKYLSGGVRKEVEVDAVVGADGANGRVAREMGAGNYSFALAFQERIRLPDEKMARYHNLAEMYVGSDISPDFYGWVFPKCDHVTVGTGTVSSKAHVMKYQSG